MTRVNRGTGQGGVHVCVLGLSCHNHGFPIHVLVCAGPRIGIVCDAFNIYTYINIESFIHNRGQSVERIPLNGITLVPEIFGTSHKILDLSAYVVDIIVERY